MSVNINSLNSFAHSLPITISQEELDKELEIWTNAQFTYDMQPGYAILDKTVVAQPSLTPMALPKRTRKRKSTKLSQEEIDQDKRKRNTAASARFRMKKKLKEQALEQNVKEMTLRTKFLEKRVLELEQEANWLRTLVIEKNPALLR